MNLQLPVTGQLGSCNLMPHAYVDIICHQFCSILLRTCSFPFAQEEGAVSICIHHFDVDSLDKVYLDVDSLNTDLHNRLVWAVAQVVGQIRQHC